MAWRHDERSTIGKHGPHGADADAPPWFVLAAFIVVPLAVILVATPVPEPSTYVLLLVGLGVIGFAAHRRKVFARRTPRLR